MTEGQGVWLYAVCAGPVGEVLDGVHGVGDEAVRSVEAAGLTAVVGSVDLSEFGEEALRRGLEKLETLEALARAHHRVVETVARTGDAVPTRLATVYRSDQRVRAMLEEHWADFATALERVRGRREWGVKAYSSGVTPAAAPAENAEDSLGGAGPPGKGTAYLLRRRAQMSARQDSRHAALASAARLHADLSGFAVAVRRHAPQDQQLSGEAGWMVLNGAYLVDEASTTTFTRAVRDLAERAPAIKVQLTGPWPPYSFAAADFPQGLDEQGLDEQGPDEQGG